MQLRQRSDGDLLLNNRFYLFIALGSSLAGILVSAYLTYAQLSVVSGVCSIGQWFNCDTVLTSPYSKISGVPLAVIGLTWFFISAMLTVTILEGLQQVRALFIWGVLGLIGVAYLNYVELIVLRTICPYCLTAHILGITVLVATIFYAKT